MQFKAIGIVSPGDMGQAVALRLKECGFEVCAALEGRSPRTKALAAEAGIEDCGSLAALAGRCDLILSILDPGVALDTARKAADAMLAAGRAPVYADCNAVAPQTKLEMEKMVRGAGGKFIDVGLIGPPPRGTSNVRIYASGPEAGLLSSIVHAQLPVRIVSDRVGDAAAVKMCYGAVTKGMIALGAELMIAARRLGVEEALKAEMTQSQGPILDWLGRNLPTMPPKAYRWVPETREIAATFEHAGLTPRTMLGAADMYVAIAATTLGRESPEAAREAKRSAEAVVSTLSSEAK